MGPWPYWSNKISVKARIAMAGRVAVAALALLVAGIAVPTDAAAQNTRKNKVKSSAPAVKPVAAKPAAAAAATAAAAAAARQSQAAPAAAPQEPPQADPTIAKDSRIAIAAELGLSLSTALKAKHKADIDDLLNEIAAVLLANDFDLPVKVKAVAGYEPIGEDDLAVARDGDSTAEVAGRIAEGYPGQDGPLLLTALAERGPFVILVAYIFERHADGKQTLKLVDRRITPIKDLTADTLKRIWPGCIGDKIAELSKRVRRQMQPDECPGGGSTQNGKAAPIAPRTVIPAAAPGAPVPAVQATVPSQQAAGAKPKSTGMLDDVPDTKGVVATQTGVVVTMKTLPDTKSNSVAKPQLAPDAKAPAPFPSGGPVKSADAAMIPQTPTAPQGSTPALASASPVFTPPTPQAPKIQTFENLVDAVYRQGFQWVPDSRVRKSKEQLVQALSNVAARSGSEGKCLTETIRGWGRTNYERNMLEELLDGTLRLDPIVWADQRRFTHRPSKRSQDTAQVREKCFAVPEALPPISVVFHDRSSNDQGKDYRINRDASVTAVRSNVAQSMIENYNLQQGQKVRFPTALEAFSLATTFAIAPDFERRFEFWIMLSSGRPAVFRLAINKYNSIELADYAESEANTTAALVTVQDLP